MNRITNSNFKSPILGVDPITKGIFTIEWAHMLWDYDLDEEFNSLSNSRAQGKIVITSKNNNSLYKIAKEQPLRLQGLVASVDFGTEKRFIKIITISDYTIFPSMNEIETIWLNSVTFEILDNLKYLEEVDNYKNWNLL